MPGPPVRLCKCVRNLARCWASCLARSVTTSCTGARRLLHSCFYTTSLRASSSLRDLPVMEVSRCAQSGSGQLRHSLSRNFFWFQNLLWPEAGEQARKRNDSQPAKLSKACQELTMPALVMLSGEDSIAAAMAWDCHRLWLLTVRGLFSGSSTFRSLVATWALTAECVWQLCVRFAAI